MKAKDPRILSANLLFFIWIVFIMALTLITALNVGSKIINYSAGEDRILPHGIALLKQSKTHHILMCSQAYT